MEEYASSIHKFNLLHQITLCLSPVSNILSCPVIVVETAFALVLTQNRLQFHS